MLDKLVKEYKNIFPLSTCSKILKVANTRPFETGLVGDVGRVEEKIRKVSVHFLNQKSSSLTDVHWASVFNNVFIYYMRDYLKTFGSHTVNNLKECNFLKYVKDDHYIMHIDASEAYNRTLSAILFLNNDFDGGEVYFKDVLTGDIKEIKPEPGKLIIWPSNFLFPHGVRPVKEGERFTVVAWA